MRLSSYLCPELVCTEIQASSAKTAIQAMVKVFSKNTPGLDGKAVLDALLSREAQVPTGMENGIAIPHATVESIKDTTLGVALLSNPVDFGTRDESLVSLMFMILSPADAISTHIKLLARIARLCSAQSFVHRLTKAKDKEELYKLLLEEDQKHV